MNEDNDLIKWAQTNIAKLGRGDHRRISKVLNTFNVSGKITNRNRALLKGLKRKYDALHPDGQRGENRRRSTTIMPKSLTWQQKLLALSQRFYADVVWEPKVGDFYTSSRNDLELYRIVKIEDGVVYTCYMSDQSKLSQWDLATFVSEGFGHRRVWVQNFVLGLEG